MTGRPIQKSVGEALPAPGRTTYLMCVLLLATSILFQKIALPGSGGLLGFSFAGLLGLSLFGLLSGQLVISRVGLSFFTIFGFVAALSAVNSASVELSKLSLALLLVSQFPLLLRFKTGAFDYGRLLDLINATMTTIAVIGIIQFFAQYALGPVLPFALDLLLPPSAALQGFNQLIPLTYGASIYKSNGFFMAEPSFFSQFLAIGVITEIVRHCRPSRLALYVVALLCSYSGSGLLMLGVFVPFYLLQRRQFVLLALGVLCIGIIVLAGNALQLDTLVQRASEFRKPGSSGYARFISPFVYISEHIFTDPVTLAIGRGPGSITEHFDTYSYTPFDPTWAKLFYEFGALGFATYLLFFASLTATIQPRALKGPMVFTYFILGGYTQNPFILSFLALVLIWTAEQVDETTPTARSAGVRASGLPRRSGATR